MLAGNDFHLKRHWKIATIRQVWISIVNIGRKKRVSRSLVRILLTFVLLPLSFLAAGTESVMAQGNTFFDVRLDKDEVHAFGWLLGSDLTLSIDDPSNGPGTDYSDVQTVEVANWDPNETFAEFNFRGVFEVQPGYLVTVTDGVITKDHTVVYIEVSTVDAINDIVTGYADPDVEVVVLPHGSGTPSVTAQADGAGNWTADFNGIYDLIPGVSGSAFRADEDGDASHHDWQVHNPSIIAFPAGDFVQATEWPLGASVVLTIDDPSNGSGIDYSENQIVEVAPWDPNGTNAEFQFGDSFDLQAGHIVSVTGGGTTRTHTAQFLIVTAIDIDADTVSGSADPGTEFDCWPHQDEVFVHVTADENGNWVADFSGLYDWVAGTGGECSLEPDAEGNTTRAGWQVSNPTFRINPNLWEVEVWEWPIGSVVTMNIDDPSNGPGVDYTDTQTVTEAEWDPNSTYVRFDFWDLFDVLPGFIVTLDDGTLTKSHIVTGQIVTSVDPETDQVSGTAEAESQLTIEICEESGCYIVEVTADLNGDWTANFSGLYDIVPGSGGAAHQFDEDGDGTGIHWQVRNPTFRINPDLWEVEVWEWPLGSVVTMNIDDPSNGPGVDYTDTQTVTVAEWDPNSTYVRFDFWDVFDALPGFIVTLDDGTLTKSHIVTGQIVTSVDPETDQVSGTAEAESQLTIEICEESGCYVVEVTADLNGDWTADFSGLYDLVPGTGGAVHQFDEDGDGTGIHWEVQIPTPDFTPTIEVVVPPGESIQLPVVVDLSGPVSWIGPTNALAVQMAIEDFGLIQGFAVQQTTFDGECSQVGGAAAGTIVVTNPDNVAVIGHNCSYGTSVALPWYEQAGIVVISGSTTMTNLPDFGPTVFNRTTLHENDNPDAWYPIMQALPSVQAWTTDFETRFGETPDNYAVLFYDAASLVLTRINEVATLDGSGNLVVNRATLAAAVRNTNNYIGVSGCIVLDSQGNRVADADNDCIPDSSDNAPNVFNPDQSDIDSDGVGDVADVCPSDATDTCNQSGSTSVSVDESGGSLTTPDSASTVDVPAGALSGDTSLSITDDGSGFVLTTDLGEATAVYGIVIGPPGTNFSTPITIVMSWPDTDSDGVVDGTAQAELDLFISQDGVAITGVCAVDPGCDPIANTFSFEVSSLSQFALATLNNLPPTADAGGPYSADEGSPMTLDASGSSDPDNNLALYEWDLDNDGLYDNGTGITTPVTYNDNGVFTVGLKVTDEFGEFDITTAEITILNVAPEVGVINAPIIPVQIGTPVEANATFADPGADIWTATWDWGESSTSGAIEGFNVSGVNSYETPGVYTVSLTVSDDDGGTGSSYFKYVVVYDPDGGFVTGGGWIDSPSGACNFDACEEGTTGKATFGFISKYKKGADVPSGQTEFQFQAGNLNFKSTDYEWLVVAGARAQFKGNGTINGEGSYKFILTALDADVNDNDPFTTDRFRIKIWVEDGGSEVIVYDNGLEADDEDDNAASEIGGGSIVVHRAK